MFTALISLKSTNKDDIIMTHFLHQLTLPTYERLIKISKDKINLLISIHVTVKKFENFIRH